MLQEIEIKILSEEGPMDMVPMCSAHKANMVVHELLECYNVSKEEYDEEYPRNVKVSKTKGEWEVEGLDLESVAYTQPINMT
jgi:hypothetical protein